MNRNLTVQRTTLPWLVSLADRVVSRSSRWGLPLSDIDPDRLLANAAKAAGHANFGDRRFEDGMRRVIDNVGALGFIPFARLLTRATYHKALENRLGYQREIQAHPEILDVPVRRPIFVLGFPRTGTTTIQNLLCLDESRRALAFWELITPLPRAKNKTVDRFIRRAIAWQILRAAFVIAPEQREVHDVRVDTPEECWYLFCNAFRVLNWDIQTGLESYGEWLFQQDMRWAYEEYRNWLQVLLHQRPAEQLVLKCPEHLWFVDALLEVFPDACIIWTHRDPVSSVASYSSMMALTRRMMFGRFEHKAMGPYITKRFHEGVTRAMEARDRWGNEANFFDADFTELTQDPANVMRRAMEHFGLDVAPDFEDQVRRWSEGDREDKAGSHIYSADAFGVDPEEIDRVFAPYMKRFGIKTQRAKA